MNNKEDLKNTLSDHRRIQFIEVRVKILEAEIEKIKRSLTLE